MYFICALARVQFHYSRETTPRQNLGNAVHKIGCYLLTADSDLYLIGVPHLIITTRYCSGDRIADVIVLPAID